MPATVQDVRNLDLASQFECFTEGQIESALTKTRFFVNEAAWDVGCPGRGACGEALLAAHMLASAPKAKNSSGSVPSGPVTAQAAGGLSRSYGSVAGKMSESSFSSTIYGQQYLELRAVLITTPITLSC